MGVSAIKKGHFSLIAIILALFLVSQNHLKHSFGDCMFKAIGLTPWTSKENNGLHIPVLMGIILFIKGFFWAVRYYRSRYPKMLSRLVIGFERIVVLIDKHRRMTFVFPFKGIQKNGNGFTGTVQDVGFEVKVNNI